MGLGRKTARSAAAGLLAGVMLLSGITAPSAVAAGGGGVRPGEGGSADVTQFWAYKDDASGSWGSASSIESVRAAMTWANVTMNAAGQAKAQAALDEARTECENGFKQRHPGEGDGDCRVVAVGAVPVVSGSSAVYDGSGWYGSKETIARWNTYVAPYKYNYAGAQSYNTSDAFADDPSQSVDSLMEKVVTDSTTIVVIVLDKYQPAPPNYTLSGSTQATSGVTVAGQTTAVHDRLTLSRGGSSIAENVNGKVTLHWRGVDGSTKEAKKDFTTANEGDTDLPSFSFTDIDKSWKAWPAGKWWFDVAIPQQGKMAGVTYFVQL